MAASGANGGKNGGTAPAVNGGAYPIEDHAYDVVVIGAGGAGLRAVVGCSEAGLRTACISKVFPTRSHTVAAQGGIAAALGNMGEDDWRWHMYDTVKGSDWLGDQDAIEYMCRSAPEAVYELEHWGLPFSRARGRQDLSAPVRRHDHGLRQGHRAAHLRRRRPHRPCHAAHHVRPGAAPPDRILHRIFRHRPDHGRRRPLPRRGRLNLDDGSIHRFSRADDHPRHRRLRSHLCLCTGAHTQTGDGNAMVLRAGLPLQDMEFVQFHPTGIYGAGCSSPRARAAKALIWSIPRASASWSAMRRPPRTLLRATWCRAP